MLILSQTYQSAEVLVLVNCSLLTSPCAVIRQLVRTLQLEAARHNPVVSLFHRTRHLDDGSVSRVNGVRPQLEEPLQRDHVVGQVLEHGRRLAEDAVAAEDDVALGHVKHHVVRGVARQVDNPGRAGRTVSVTNRSDTAHRSVR